MYGSSISRASTFIVRLRQLNHSSAGHEYASRLGELSLSSHKMPIDLTHTADIPEGEAKQEDFLQGALKEI